MNADQERCNECHIINGHDAFCSFSVHYRVFLKNQLRTSLRKHWTYERKFDEIKAELHERGVRDGMTPVAIAYHIDNDSKLKAATANAKYHMARATMYSTALLALD